MGTQYKKTAKDLAFERERAKLCKQIKELDSQIRRKDETIASLQKEIDNNAQELEQLRDWTSRLLEYMELSEEEMRSVLEEKKKTSAAMDKMLSFFDMANQITRSYR